VGYELKERLGEWLGAQGIEVHDVGPERYDSSDDYPDYALAVSKRVRDGESNLGIVVCSTGIGSCIAANKVPGVRAAVCHDTFSARMSREHNAANVLCLGSNIVGAALAQEIVGAWAGASFSGEERHRRRLEKVAGIEASGGA
jgi:ribose 5-phosphate isomerase B